MVDQQVQRLISARDKSAVNKLELIEFRRRHPDKPIFVFEGSEDVIVYASWIFRLQAELTYEPFPVRGKDQVLKLKNSLDKDLNRASLNVFYFVDRDYDDLRGMTSDTSIFMTDRYSIENYLTETAVIEQVLASELCCAKHPEVRFRLLGLFNHVFSAFLHEMEEVNYRIYLARINGIKILPAIPDKINTYIRIFIDRVERCSLTSDLYIALAREPSTEEAENAKPMFAKLDPALRHRGKFNLAAMMKWFQAVDEEWHKPASSIFSGVSRPGGTRYNEIVLGSLAARSSMPHGLYHFLSAVPIKPNQPVPT